MAIINTILNFIIAVGLIVMIYLQIEYIKSDWCGYEIEKIYDFLEEILNEL